MENPTDKDRLLLNYHCVHRFRCEDSNTSFMHVQSHYYRVRQVEPCHQLGEEAGRSSSALAERSSPQFPNPPFPHLHVTH